MSRTGTNPKAIDFMATIALSLGLLSDQELISLKNSIVFGSGVVQEGSFAYDNAKKLQIIDEDGRVNNPDETSTAIDFEQQRRKAGKTAA